MHNARRSTATRPTHYSLAEEGTGIRSLAEHVARSLSVIAILVGIWLRASAVERKVVWNDEVATALHVAGHTEAQVSGLLDRPSGLNTREVSALLSPLGTSADHRTAPLPERGVLGALAEAEPQTAPIFFLATRAATELGAECIRSARTISALAGIATIAVAGALSATLAGSALAGWIAAGLVALSPVQIRYSQEARSYALWALLAVGSTLALVRANDRNTPRSWLSYGILAALALATHLFSALVFGAQLIWVAATKSGRLRWAVAAAIGALVACSPWFVALWRKRAAWSETSSWSAVPIGADALAISWVGMATQAFVRTGGEGGLLSVAEDSAGGPRVAAILAAHPHATLALRLSLAAAILALAVRAFVPLVRLASAETATARRDSSAALLLAALCLVPWLALALPDLLLGGHRSAIARYLLPSALALQVAVALVLVRGLSVAPGTSRRSWSLLLYLTLLAMGAASAASAARLSTWWDTNPTGLRDLGAMATILDREPAATVRTDAPVLWILTLARQLHSQVTFVRAMTEEGSPADGRTYTWLMKQSEGPSALALPGDPNAAAEIGVERGPGAAKAICILGDQFLVVCPRLAALERLPR